MIGLGSDHGGFQLKEAVKAHLEERGIAYKDYGIYEERSVDYPDIAEEVSRAVVKGECERATFSAVRGSASVYQPTRCMASVLPSARTASVQN